MTADISAGAASRNMDWQAIDWRKANQNVRRLQARIVKAIQEGTPIVRHVKVKNRANPFDPQWYDYFEQRQRRFSVGMPCPS